MGEARPLDAIKRTVAQTVGEFHMLTPGEAISVAFSGGPDSTALAILLLELGYKVTLLHVDHAMRPGSFKDIEHCTAVADSMGVELLHRRVAVSPPTESEARAVRYVALLEMSTEAGTDKIATGHTSDDDAETVLMRKRRGGFPLGIPPKRGRFVRPLIRTRRSDTRAVCAGARIAYLEDPTNQDLRFTRNRTRLELTDAGDALTVELLNQGYAARREASQTLRRAAEVVDQRAGLGDAGLRIDRGAVASEEPSVRKAIVRMLLGEAGLDPYRVSSRLVSDITSKVLPVTGSRLDVSANLSIWSEPDHLMVGVHPEPPTLPEIPIAVPGTTVCEGWGFVVHASQGKLPTDLDPHGLSQAFDGSVGDRELSLRQFQPGDRMIPLGMKGSKKIHDIFIDEKLPRRTRASIGLVVSGDTVAWLIGIRMSESFKVTSASRSVIVIEIEPWLREATADT
ncbi:MAG: tRNA lysidine(34) synthetase TilS [Actinomycetota bacterium]